MGIMIRRLYDAWVHTFAANLVLALGSLMLCIVPVHPASFSGNARLEINDPSGALSWNASKAALSIQAWFRISVPSGVNITEDMTILVNRRSGSLGDTHAYLLLFNATTGNVEFSARGSGGSYSNVIVERPYLDRWYHVAIVRQGEVFAGYLDGRLVFSASAGVGNAATSDGVSVGGWNNSKYFYGEVQECSIYQTALSQDFIVQHMFVDQPALGDLKGYYKFGFSTNSSENLRNFAPAPLATATEGASKQGSGAVEFEEASQAGEQSYFDAQKNGARDFLAALSGGYSRDQVVLSRSTPGITFELRFGYSTANSFGGFKLGGNDPYAAGPLGKGWRHVFETRVIPSQTFSPLSDTDTIGLMNWEGSIETWDKVFANATGTLTEYRTRSKQARGEVILTSTNCQWVTPERLVYVFRHPSSGAAVMRGRLESILDFNSNTVRIAYNEILGEITSVTDTAGGRFDFFHTNGLLGRISFGAWSVNMAYDATNRLISLTKTNTSGLYTNVNTTWKFAYYATNGLLEQITAPRANTAMSLAYDKYGRKVEERDALGRTTRFQYGVPGKRQITTTDEENHSWVMTFDRKHRLVSRKDPLGNETVFNYTEAGEPASVREPLGWTTTMGYDGRGNVTAITNALAEVSLRSFHPFFNKPVTEINALGWANQYEIDDRTGNLMRHFDALGDLVRYTYASNGLPETATDGNGKETVFRYDANGFLMSRTDPANKATHYSHNELGWKLTETNPLGEVTAFSYDLNGNVVRILDPLARVLLKSYDGNNNLVSETDAKGKLTVHTYDAANQKIETVDRAGNKWKFGFTRRGKLQSSTDPLGFSFSTSYDAGNRLASTTDPIGNVITYRYDANGKVIELTDELGQRWSKEYDRLNRVRKEINPLGDVRETTYDAAGRVVKVITPKGFVSSHEYDGRGRLIKWIDAEGFIWRYAYDGIQNIQDITDALGGHYMMAYGPRNERVLERNQDGFEWRYEYDDLLRLKRQIDPNGLRREIAYDRAGRIDLVSFSSGRTDDYSYDENNNLKVLARTKPSDLLTTTSFDFDAMDRITRVIEYTAPFSKEISYTYDPRGLRSTLVYPDGKVLNHRYDAAGRLTNQVDWAGRQLTYAYDPVGRLLRRTYPNGIVQSNGFDNAGQITNLTYSSSTGRPSTINIALQYAYDRNGNKASSTETGTLQWSMPASIREAARHTASGRLIDREIENISSGQVAEIKYRYDAGGNMTNAFAGSQSWELEYDEDNRTTVMRSLTNGVGTIIVNRYDTLGRRVSRTINGSETRYVLDLTGKMERILCDMDRTGTINAWYVHGPDLCYKVDSVDTLTYYHADANANVIALTGADGSSRAHYAYSPYGRTLGTTNLQGQVSNPYLFVGAQGVMQELPGLYFMRARYYSAEAGVFLSTDPIKPIGPGWRATVYAYGEGNPLSFLDPQGTWAVWDDALFAGGGAIAGVAGQFASDLIAGDGLSSLESYVGAAVGGAAGGEALLYSGNPFVAGAVAGGVGDLTTQGLENLSGKRNGVDWGQAAFSTGIGGGGGIIGAKIPIPGLDAGRGSASAIGRQIATKLNAGMIRPGGVQLGTIGKIAAGNVVEGLRDGAIEAGLRIGTDLTRSAFDQVRTATTAGPSLAAKTVQASQYAAVRNVQSVAAKLPSPAVSTAASVIGNLAGNAVGKILPKNTPPVVREVAKVAVSATVTKVVTAIVVAIGVSKKLIIVFVSLFLAAVFRCYYPRLFARILARYRRNVVRSSLVC
jgi:RHS repeat-associated protein